MNPLLDEYFNSVEASLIESSIVRSYTIICREISLVDGKMRVKAVLEDNFLLEFFLYLVDKNEHIEQSKYSFHWQNAQGGLIKRWDNAPHHPSLKNAPHHTHIGDDHVEASLDVPDVFFVIEQIEADLNMASNC
ncbi:conserved hypothetical protein [Gammaproteobacteria bacterium]